jgi:Fungal chitosanase of glycosyl hydrolase group 75
MSHQFLSAAIGLALPLAGMAHVFASPMPPRPADACPAQSLLLTFDVYRFGQLIRQAPVWRLGDGPAFFFTSGMTIDADGAPNAYNADDTGLDYLFNAGQSGQWDGIIQDETGEPVIQGPDDPFPGYYISCTALFDHTRGRRDPARFVDSTMIPYIALPGDLARQTGARLGDFAFVSSARTGKSSYAIFADIGTFGEGSIALATNLGIRSDARRGGSWGGVSYVVFPGSGDSRPRTVEEINGLGSALVEAWGGPEKIGSCTGTAADETAAPLEASRNPETSSAKPVSDQSKLSPDAPAN